MRVMMIGPYPRSPEQIDGGVAAAMTYLSQALVMQSGIDLVGVRIGGNDLFDKSRAFNWPMCDLPLGRLGLTSLYRDQRLGLKRLIAEYKPDLIHAQGVDVEGYLAVRSGVPSVVTVHGVLGQTARFKEGIVGRARAALTARLTEKSTVRRSTDLISISPYVAQYYSREVRGRVHDVPNAVGDSFFELVRRPERGRVLFAGRIARGKGVLDLVRAFAISAQDSSRLVLAGSSPDPAYEEAIRSEIAKSGLQRRVELVGLLSERALLSEFARAESLVLPSYQETAPMVVQQAMAAGIAVIATRVGGIPYMIENSKTGFLVDAGNSEQIAESLAAISSDTKTSEDIGKRAKEIAIEQFRAAEVARRTRNVYESRLARHP